MKKQRLPSECRVPSPLTVDEYGRLRLYAFLHDVPMSEVIRPAVSKLIASLVIPDGISPLMSPQRGFRSTAGTLARPVSKSPAAVNVVGPRADVDDVEPEPADPVDERSTDEILAEFNPD